MHFSTIFAVAALASPLLAAPAALPQPDADVSAISSPLAARADTVTCRPKTNKSSKKSFNVDIAYAKSQATKAGFKAGKSGDPHAYHNGDKLVFGVKECDVKDAPLWEYPVFWQGTAPGNGQIEWVKDLKTDKQKMKTPIRVVYVNQNGGAKYCGVMTHAEVEKDYQGKDFFQICN